MNLTELEQNPAFIEFKKLYLNVFSENTKPEHLANDARKFAEAICYQIFIAKISQNHNKPLELGKYLEEFKKKDLPLNDIYPIIEVIQKIGNFNSHYQVSPIEITTAYILPAQAAVDFLMNWFLNSQLNCTALTVMQGEFYQTQANAESASESSFLVRELPKFTKRIHNLNPEFFNSFLLDDIKNKLYNYSVKDLVNICEVDLQKFNKPILTTGDFLEALFNFDIETRQVLLTIVEHLKSEDKALAAWYELARYYFSITSKEKEFDDFKPLKPKVSSEKENVIMISIAEQNSSGNCDVNISIISGTQNMFENDVKFNWKSDSNDSTGYSGFLNRTVSHISCLASNFQENVSFIFEFILNDDKINEKVESWEYGKLDKPGSEKKLCFKYPVVVRPLRRQKFRPCEEEFQDWKSAWLKLERFFEECSSSQIQWLSRGNPSSGLKSFFKKECVPLFALNFQPDWEKEHVDIFNRIVEWGVPVVAWSRQHDGTKKFRTTCTKRLKSKPIAQLYDHIQALRLCFDDEQQHPCHHITLLWDNPNHLIQPKDFSPGID